MRTRTKKERKKKILFHNHQANKTCLETSKRCSHLFASFNRFSSSLKLISDEASRLVCQQNTRMPFPPFALSLSLYYFLSHHTILTVNHYHHSYFLLQALYNRLFASEHQFHRSRANE